MTALSDERDLLPDTGILAKLRRNEEASLLVRLALGGIGKEEAHLARLRNGKRVIFVQNRLPAGFRVDRQAVVQTQSHIKSLAELIAQLRGNEQSALGVDRVSVFSVHSLSPRSHFIFFAPLGSTLFI